MMTRIYLVILLSVLSVAPCHAQKPSLKETMKAQMEESLKHICIDQSVLGCLGISQQVCDKAVQTALQKCEPLFPKNGTDESALDAHSQCIEKTLPPLFGVPSDKIDSCLGTTQNGEHMPHQSILMAAQHYNKVHTRLPPLSAKGVTLPVYKNATLMAHISDEKQLQSRAKMYGTKSLPDVLLASRDTLAVVANYYRKHLHHFKEYKLHNGVLFIEKGPEKFSMVRDMKLYVSTPHVMIVKDSNDPMAPKGTNSKINIAYRK